VICHEATGIKPGGCSDIVPAEVVENRISADCRVYLNLLSQHYRLFAHTRLPDGTDEATNVTFEYKFADSSNYLDIIDFKYDVFNITGMKIGYTDYNGRVRRLWWYVENGVYECYTAQIEERVKDANSTAVV
jgi:hypothetical protein